jgi:hypothetical protein
MMDWQPRHVWIVLCLAMLWPAASLAADSTARESVGRPVQQAQQLLKQKKTADAQAKLREAAAVKDKTPYETYIVEATRASIEIEVGQYAQAIEAFEATLATGVPSSGERQQIALTEVQLAYQIKAYPRVVDLAARYYRDGGTEAAPRTLMAQSQYLIGDFAAAVQTIRAVAQADQNTGRKTPEPLLRALASAEYQRKDDRGYRDALVLLVRGYPGKESWSELLTAVEREPGFPQRLALDLTRLKIATGTADTAEPYVFAAELALEAGLPGDAKAILEKGFAAGILGKDSGNGRHRRLLAAATRQSAEDEKTLSQLARDAAAAPNGVAWGKLADAYASYGRYPDAVAAYESALKKGGLGQADDTKLHLGVAYLRVGQVDAARRVLGSLTGPDGYAELGRLWLLHAGQG